jgi:hypothetical protein
MCPCCFTYGFEVAEKKKGKSQSLMPLTAACIFKQMVSHAGGGSECDAHGQLRAFVTSFAITVPKPAQQ